MFIGSSCFGNVFVDLNDVDAGTASAADAVAAVGDVDAVPEMRRGLRLLCRL